MLWEEASICTLCQRRIGSEIANPSKCSHCFHAECIRKYANENNYGGRSKCPVKGCRNIFLRIDVRNEASNDKFPQFIIVESRHRCPICGDVIQDPFAKTNICQHNFCYQCLKESATYRTICPVDRKNFTEIFIFDRNKDPIFKSVSIFSYFRIEKWPPIL